MAHEQLDQLYQLSLYVERLERDLREAQDRVVKLQHMKTRVLSCADNLQQRGFGHAANEVRTSVAWPHFSI